VLIVDISVTPGFCKKSAFRKKTVSLLSSDFNLPPQRRRRNQLLAKQSCAKLTICYRGTRRSNVGDAMRRRARLPQP
jgi:hypothetical protein